jgi:hypothetical protein
MVCRSVCQKEADDRGATRVLPLFLQQWTKLGLVFFLPVVMIFLFFSFVRSALSTFVSFSVLFLSRSIFLFVLTRCPLALLVSLFFTYFLLSFLLCLCFPLLFNSLPISSFPVPFVSFNSYFTIRHFLMYYTRLCLLIYLLSCFLFPNAFLFCPLHSSAINSILT